MGTGAVNHFVHYTVVPLEKKNLCGLYNYQTKNSSQVTKTTTKIISMKIQKAVFTILIFVTQMTTVSAQHFSEKTFFKTFSHYTVSANGINFHFVSGGKGEAVLLLHGWPEDWYEWRDVMPALAENHTVYAIDLRGWGKTDKPDSGYTILSLAEDINQLMIALHLEKVNIVGHDWGAPIGYAFSALHPEKVSTLTLVEASMPGIGGEKLLNFTDKWTPLWFFPFLATPGLAEEMINGKERIFYSWILQHMASHPDSVFTESDIDYYINTNTNPKLTKASCEYYRNIYVTTEQIKKLATNKLTLPVMVIGAEKSLGQWMIDAVKNSFAPNAKGIIMKDCGHIIPEEKPHELAGYLLNFFSKKE
jgi:pimeloyl-ACP methyl ester carboxylesterase